MLKNRLLIFSMYFLCCVGVAGSLVLWRALRHNEELVLNFINFENKTLRDTVQLTLNARKPENSAEPNAVQPANAATNKAGVIKDDGRDFAVFDQGAPPKLGLLISGNGMISDAAFAAGIAFTILLVLTAISWTKRTRYLEELKNQIKARRRSEESLHYARQIIENAADAIITARADGEIVSTNSAAERLLDNGAALMCGRNITEFLLAPEGFPLSGEISRERATGSALVLAHEMTARRFDGAHFPVEVSVSSGLVDGQVLRSFIVRDATERKTREQGLQNIIKALKRSQDTAVDIMEDLRRERIELTRINEELKKAELKALSSVNAKSAFLANMSHEIRTPLTAVIGFTESALKLKLRPEEHEHVLKAALRNGQHLLQLIDDILCFSKIEAGKLDVERIECSLKEVLEDVQGAMKLKSLEKGIDFQTRCLFPLPRQVMCDPMRLKQVLYNIVANAIKFTPRGSVLLTVELLREQEKLRFEITDTGIGMSPDVVAHLFGAFEQGDPSTTRRYGGTGLGLVITKQLIEMLGGAIKVQSKEGAGTTVALTIDVRPVAAEMLVNDWSAMAWNETPLEENIAAPAQFHGRVLVADDAHDNQELLTMLLVKRGLEVVIAENGRDAVDLALNSDFDLVLMDMHMPILDGYQAVIELRDRGFKKPIFAVTASAMGEALNRCMEIGCNGYLRKPFEYDDFEKIITESLQQKKAPVVDGEATRKYRPQRVKKLSIEEISKGWVQRLPERVKNLKQALSASNFDEVRETAHILRGAKNFGQAEIGEAAAKLEDAAISRDLAMIQREIAQVEALMRLIIQKSSSAESEPLVT